jgi:DNA-binding transcriptional regulator YdaS (Cro superfamily)
MSDVTKIIEEAIALLGSEAKLGAAAGKSQNAIWSAKRAGRVSPDLAIGIERATGGQIPRWRLRPDLWSPPGPAPHREGAAA